MMIKLHKRFSELMKSHLFPA